MCYLNFLYSLPSKRLDIVGIDFKWTLPEKLLSIQKMFHLSKVSLVKFVVSQPLLLTCSIDRNIGVSNFLTNKVGLQPDELKRLVNDDARVAMAGMHVLQGCWHVSFML